MDQREETIDESSDTSTVDTTFEFEELPMYMERTDSSKLDGWDRLMDIDQCSILQKNEEVFGVDHVDCFLVSGSYQRQIVTSLDHEEIHHSAGTGKG